MRLSVQDSLVPGSSLMEKMRTAARIGFDAIELRSAEALAAPEELRPFIGALPLPVGSICTNPQQDPVVEERDVREARLGTLHELIRIAGDLGARGIVLVPIRRPHRLPDLTPLYTSSELEMALLYRILDDLVPRAERAGTAFFLEPLNFYEAMLVTTVGKAVEICQHYSSPGLRLMVDTFHANIMEREPIGSFQLAGPFLGHVHLSDSNRQLPGLGHIPFQDVFTTLYSMGYTGDMAIEAIPPANPEIALAECAAFLRQALAQAV